LNVCNSDLEFESSHARLCVFLGLRLISECVALSSVFLYVFGFRIYDKLFQESVENDGLVTAVGKGDCEHDVSSVLERVHGYIDHLEDEGRRNQRLRHNQLLSPKARISSQSWHGLFCLVLHGEGRINQSPRHRQKESVHPDSER
jgi:hypothetical protein